MKKLALFFVFVQSLVFANNPVITLQGNNPMVLEVGTTYVDPGATAVDEHDGDLTNELQITGSVNSNIVGTYQVEYSVTDSEGNTTTVHRTIEVIDTTPPVITLNGATTIYLELGSTYTELGATATDNYDGNLSSEIFLSGSVDTSTAGTYYISYNATDSSGNVANQKVRTVIIEDIYPSLEIINTAIIYDDDVDGYNGLGDTIEYTIAVENTGNINLSDVYITDNLTALNGDSLLLTTGPTFISNSSSSTEGTLQPGETATYIATYVISQQAVDAGGVTISASAAAVVNENTTVTDVSDSPVVTLIGTTPSISITLEATVTHIGDADIADRVVRADDIIDYTITITNTGNVTLTDLAVVDALTDGAGNDLVMTSDPTNQWTIASLAPGAAETYTPYYTIGSAAVLTGSISNVVTVTGDTPNGTDDITAFSNSTVILIDCLDPSLVIQDPGTDDQTICEGNSIAAIQYAFENGTEEVQFQWTSQNVPNGLTQSFSSGVYSITGTPDAQSATSVYTYQIIPINSISGCVGAPATGSITVYASSNLVLINAGNESQSICEGNPIAPIEYSVGNAVSGINLTWTKDGISIAGNPPGIDFNLNASQFVLEGNLYENITATTTYSYNIQTTGGLCGSGNANGTIVVHPIPRIQLAATTAGSLSQIKCEGDVIDDIVLNLLDGASSPGVIGLPAGVSYAYDSVANTLTFSGFLDASNPNDNYNYTVTASGSSGGCTASLSGVLTISREDVLTPMSEISQSVCEGNQITPISFNYSGGAIGVTLQWSVNGSVINLPSGLVVDNQEGNLTISGTLENFNSGDEISYSVTTNNSGCTPAKSYSGIITIVPTEQCIEPGKIILNGPVEVNDGTFYIKKEDGLILYSSFDDQCYQIKVHTGQVIAEPINCD